MDAISSNVVVEHQVVNPTPNQWYCGAEKPMDMISGGEPSAAYIVRVHADQNALQKFESVPVHKPDRLIFVKKLLLLLTIGIVPGSKTD